MSESPEWLAKLARARDELEEAVRALDSAMRDIEQRDRADKSIILPVLESAFARVREARSALAELELAATKKGE
jgi:hypothetical protein